MKKITALLITLTAILVFALAACSNNDTFTEKSYSSGDAEVEKVVVQVDNREVDISASQDNKIYINYFDGEKEYLDITVSENKELIIKLAVDKNWTDAVGVKPSKEYRKIQIKLPDALLASLSVSTTNENIKVAALSFNDKIDLTSNGGDITCERINAGKSISLTAKNGSISGSIIGGWDDYQISCSIKKGNCNLPALKEGGEKLLSADCNNGDINIQFVK